MNLARKVIKKEGDGTACGMSRCIPRAKKVSAVSHWSSDHIRKKATLVKVNVCNTISWWAGIEIMCRLLCKCQKTHFLMQLQQSDIICPVSQ